MPCFYVQLLHATRSNVGMPAIIAECCMQKLHATIAHETTSKIIMHNFSTLQELCMR